MCFCKCKLYSDFFHNLIFLEFPELNIVQLVVGTVTTVSLTLLDSQSKLMDFMDWDSHIVFTSNFKDTTLEFVLEHIMVLHLF